MRKAAGNVIPAVTVNVKLISPPRLENLTANHPRNDPWEGIYDYPDYRINQSTWICQEL